MKESEQKSRSLSLSDLEDLEKSGVVPLENQSEAEALFRKSIHWKDWIIKSTATLGLLFFLAGAVFFFASNWKGMSPLLRFGVLEGCVILATIVAMWRGLTKVSGQTALFIASMFTGILLAVYGQIYQTGADAFEIYALWAALIVIWVIASRSMALWTLWITVTQTAIALFIGQVLTPSGVFWEVGFCALGLFNLALLAAWETLHRKDSFFWMKSEWFRALILGAGLFWLTASPIRWIFDFYSRGFEAPAIGTFVWVVALLTVLFFYYLVRPNVIAVGIGLLVAASIVVLAIARSVFEGDWDLFGWFLTSVLSLLVFGGAASLLVKFNQMIRKEESA